jgi:hypothetical protein
MVQEPSNRRDGPLGERPPAFVYIVTQAWEGEILGVFWRETDASVFVEQICSDPDHKPTMIEMYPVQ